MSLDVMQTLAVHRTQREFTSRTVSDELMTKLVTAAQHMPTSQYLQAYSLIEITQPDLRTNLARITTMPTVGKNGRLFVILADQHRNVTLVPGKTAQRALSEFDRFAGSIEDATLMTAALVMAAESQGLGSVVLGSINNATQAVINLLHLPKLTLPVFGLQLGYPTTRPEVKPRLPLDALWFKNRYAEPADYRVQLDQFDQQLHAYYQSRSTNARDEHLAQMTTEALHSAAKRRDFLKVVRRQGFLPEA